MPEHDPSIGPSMDQDAEHDTSTHETAGLGLEPMEETTRRAARWPWLVLAAALAVAAALGTWVYVELNKTTVEPPAAQVPEQPKRDYMTQIPAAPPAETPAPETTEAPAPAPTAPAEPQGPTGNEVIQADFVTDLARFAASRYHPAGTRDNDTEHGLSTLTFKALNMRYGTQMTGLTHEVRDLEAAREEIFTALMHPIILRLVFNLYADDFTAALADQARAQARDFAQGSGYRSMPLGEAHVAELLRITARQCRDMGAVFESFARRPELADSVVRYFDAADRVNAAYADFADAQAAGADASALNATAEAIKQSIKERERLKESVVAGLRSHDNNLSDGQVLDIATWITRRLRGHAGRINAVGAIASLSRELADKLENAATPGG